MTLRVYAEHAERRARAIIHRHDAGDREEV